jgi:hypothetical protein
MVGKKAREPFNLLKTEKLLAVHVGVNPLGCDAVITLQVAAVGNRKP